MCTLLVRSSVDNEHFTNSFRDLKQVFHEKFRNSLWGYGIEKGESDETVWR